jgi:hypothetical protein
MEPTMAEMQDELDRLGWEVACINSNQPDGGIVWRLVAKRGGQGLSQTAFAVVPRPPW